MKTYTTIATCIIGFCLAAGNVRAAPLAPAEMIKVSPAILPISLVPGTANTHALTVENLTDMPLPFSVDIADLERPDDNNQSGADEPAGDMYNPSWVRLSKTDLLLPAHASDTVDVTVTVPGTVSLGGFYAVINLTPLVPLSQTNKPQVIPRVGVPILGNIGVEQDLPPDQRARIRFFSLPGLAAAITDIPWQLQVVNTQLQYFSAKPILTMSRLFGGDIISDFPEQVILPGRTRSWNDRVSVPGYGFYTATMRVSLGRGDTISMRTYTVVLPWRNVGIAILLMIVALYLLKHRNNLRRALRILVYGE